MANATKKATLGARILEGLDQAIAWSDGKKIGARVTPGVAPKVDVKELRQKMGLSQAQFATRFGLPPGTLRNWEQGRATPDAPTQVLLAVIARHPEAVEDSLRLVK
jgi:putative transcriptional regulator